VVDSDLNRNGASAPGEGPLAVVAVALRGCGPALTQTTADDDAFAFGGLLAGSGQVEVSKSGRVI
jgi:hypothetical protein